MLYVFSILFDEKIPYWDVMFAGATVVTVAINNSPEMVSLFVFSMIMSVFWKLSPCSYARFTDRFSSAL
ncbi:hypothetical protein, partial [Leuconostoc mesenteroides]|uniref:hypothetical protein n=2 Tax=Leuconostoc mesenteroides TaxID=1245 RepID=UPI00235EB580